ncbi:MAG TPA: hypothetical protein VKN82_05860 [Desulfohalobiaceae bacterium]|nr:hypothetical protein [Desulfohalobiaceae bacterium]
MSQKHPAQTEGWFDRSSINISTSYFANINYLTNPVSIARSEPKWFIASFKEPPVYKKLAPSWSLIGKSKQGKISLEEYIDIYYQSVLKGTDPFIVITELILNFGAELTLICWEKPGNFCHRRLVATWLEENTGLFIPEI